MNKELFTLLRLGLGDSTPQEENLSDLIMMSSEQWVQLGVMAYKQGVLGIALDGVDCLDLTPYGPTQGLPKQLKLEWIGKVMQIEQANNHQIKVMNELAQKWIDGGCHVMVMKGQANGLMYPNPLHRNPGDIDCYLLGGGYALGNDVARLMGAKVDEGWYKHSSILYQGETFENHQFFVHTRDGKRSKLLQKELVEGLNVKDWKTYPQSDIVLPPVQWNAMFLTYHACAHFITEGLRLKQVVDWAMFLKTYQGQIDWNKYNEYCERFHLSIFSEAITAICVEKNGLHLSDKKIKSGKAYMDKVLHDVIYNNDYIYSERDGIWKCRWMVLRNLFKYRWKYNEIYQESVWKQLWFYISGVIFRTEK